MAKKRPCGSQLKVRPRASLLSTGGITIPGDGGMAKPGDSITKLAEATKGPKPSSMPQHRLKAVE